MAQLYTWLAVLAVCGTFSLIGWRMLAWIDRLLEEPEQIRGLPAVERPYDWAAEDAA